MRFFWLPAVAMLVALPTCASEATCPEGTSPPGRVGDTSQVEFGVLESSDWVDVFGELWTPTGDAIERVPDSGKALATLTADNELVVELPNGEMAEFGPVQCG
jgi:hypothetical protein